MEWEISYLLLDIKIKPNSEITLHCSDKEVIYFSTKQSIYLLHNNKEIKCYSGDRIVYKGIDIFNPHPVNIQASAIVLKGNQYINRILYKFSDKAGSKELLYFFDKILKNGGGDLSIPVAVKNKITHIVKDERFVQGHTYKHMNQYNNKLDGKLLKINRYILKNYMKPITLYELAELVNYNPVYLSNVYSATFGVSPMKHIQQLRMIRAQKYLLETDLSVQKIANSVGYISTSQFCSLFKRYFQTTPFKYRRMQGASNS